MTRTELAKICSEIIDRHIDDLRTELPSIYAQSTYQSESTESNIGNIIANVSANSIRHSVQAVTDVLANLDLIELDD